MHYIQLTVTWCVHTGSACTRTWTRAAPTSAFCVCRRNNVSRFIPDRQPDFPDQKFEAVTGDPFFVDENLLVKPEQHV